MEELKAICTEGKVDVIGISEAWRRPDISDAEYDIDGYQLFRRDHKTGHGGVVIYVRNELHATVFEGFQTGFEDSVWCCINIENENQLLVGTIYRSTSTSDENNEK
jgi:exonuclease III